jgi:hypothetical protein
VIKVCTSREGRCDASLTQVTGAAFPAILPFQQLNETLTRGTSVAQSEPQSISSSTVFNNKLEERKPFDD